MLPYSKLTMMIEPQTLASAATVTGRVDTRGFDFAVIDVSMSTVNDTTNVPTTFNLLESDDTVVTNHTALAPFVAGGAGGWTMPTLSLANFSNIKFNVDLRHVHRWLRMTIAPLTNITLSATCNLFRADETPIAAATAGVTVLVSG